MKYLGIFLISFAAAAVPILLVGLLIKTVSRDDAEPNKHKVKKDTSDEPLDLRTKLMLGAMGAKLLDERIEEHERESKKKERELFYWQDSIRDEMRHDEIDTDDDII